MSDYAKIWSRVPEYYKSKYKAQSLTPLQELALLKNFLEKDVLREGWIKYRDMVIILRENLQFKASDREIERIIRDEYEDFSENIENDKINFPILVQICDILKREKLILVQLGNNLNYMIFVILLTLIVVYIAFFYSYKNNL